MNGKFKTEPPTIPFSKEHRAAKLVKNWAACSTESQKLIEQMAARLALLGPKEAK